jgi:hypothetical protein
MLLVEMVMRIVTTMMPVGIITTVAGILVVLTATVRVVLLITIAKSVAARVIRETVIQADEMMPVGLIQLLHVEQLQIIIIPLAGDAPIALCVQINLRGL